MSCAASSGEYLHCRTQPGTPDEAEMEINEELIELY